MSNQNQKDFYDSHSNFASRTLIEYNVAPGIRCKFDTIVSRIGKKKFNRALDVGCSGNSFIHFLPNVEHRVFCELADLPLIQYSKFRKYHPVCGSITEMPFLDNTFDLITCLDVLEHIPDDQTSADEIVRILKPKGLAVITVPHRMKYYTEQDRICGHVRRYEYEQIRDMFVSRGLKELMVFPVYGQIMKIADIQEADPDGTEEGINKLRDKYQNDSVFRVFWDKISIITAKVMRMDAKYIPFSKTMDICLIFRKPVK